MSDLIELTGKQRIELEHLLMRHTDSRLYQRAFALLLLDDGQSAEQIASSLRVSRRTVYNWASRFQQRHDLAVRERLADAERAGRPVTVKASLIHSLMPSLTLIHATTAITQPSGLPSCCAATSASSISKRPACVPSATRWCASRSAGSTRATHSPVVIQTGDRQRGLKRGLWTQPHVIVLMLDEVIVTETPPLYCCYGRIGQQVCVPITGNRAKRIVHGALNITTGELLLLITEVWDELTHQFFLEMIHRHWRGWRIILFEDRGTPHTAEDSLALASELGMQVRLLPRACPELNAMDHLFRFVKSRGVANQPTRSIEESAMAACRSLYALSRRERLTKAGVLSGNFWLTS